MMTILFKKEKEKIRVHKSFVYSPDLPDAAMGGNIKFFILPCLAILPKPYVDESRVLLTFS